MFSKRNIFRTALAVFCMVSMCLLSFGTTNEVYASSGYEFVILGTYDKQMKVGDEFYLSYLTTTGKKPSFSSSNSKVASVNTYGKITAKAAGSAKITAKIKNGEASCKITVVKTSVRLNLKSVRMECGYTQQLIATSSTGHEVKWKSKKSSIASVDENGLVRAKKPGKTTITATVDKSVASCSVTVKEPSVRLNKTYLSLYRKGKAKLTVSSTSKSTPKWKSNKKSVATVDSKGNVTAVKNGTALITVTVDGVSKSCEVVVKKPDITFDSGEITLLVGESKKVHATVSSGNKPTYSCSNTNVVTVSESGKIRGISPGKAYVYASEDGTKVRLTVRVKAEE